MHHHLHSSPETCHWGFFEAKLKPVLTVGSGDEVTIDTISGGPEVVPDRSKFHVPPELAEVHARNERMVPGHILTGRWQFWAPSRATCWKSRSSMSGCARTGGTT